MAGVFMSGSSTLKTALLRLLLTRSLPFRTAILFHYLFSDSRNVVWFYIVLFYASYFELTRGLNVRV